MRDMPEGGTSDIVGSRKSGEDSKSYRNFQLAKLKGLCCVQTNSKLPPIWDYLKATKDADVQCMQLVEEMMAWVKQYNVQINRGLYFDKTTIINIARLEFSPGPQRPS